MSKTVSVIIPILAPTPFLRALAEFTIKTLRMHANKEYELIVCEAQHYNFNPINIDSRLGPEPELRIDNYLNFTPGIGGVREVNKAIDGAKGDYILLTGTDVIAPQGWDTELLTMFERADCGVASLSAYEPNATVGPLEPISEPAYVEGMFSPFMMIKKGWRYDEAYQRIYQDSDLIMRMYESGLRAYRSSRKHVWHLGSVTNKGASDDHVAMHNKALAKDERLFHTRWGKSPLWMYGVIRSTTIVYGREFEAWLRPIHQHYDPNATEG